MPMLSIGNASARRFTGHSPCSTRDIHRVETEGADFKTQTQRVGSESVPKRLVIAAVHGRSMLQIVFKLFAIPFER